MWQKCGDCHNCHNYPRRKNVEKKFKNPHKIDFFHIFHIFILKMWSEKALVYIAKVPFSTFPRFSKTFWKKISRKDILALKCGKRVKLSYYCWYTTKVASTFLKPKMWKMWKPAITNGYLRLKMWKKMCSRNYGNRKRYGVSNKYDDRRRILG